MNVGVVAFQGAVSEHVSALKRAFAELGVSGTAKEVRTQSDLKDLCGLVIPGGESTTISRQMMKTGTFQMIKKMGEEGLPILGTCAGCILLAKEGDMTENGTKIEYLGLMDMKVSRNAFGRQRESFEITIDIKGLNLPFRAVFIRAPVILKVWGGCESLATFQEKTIFARQDNLLACAFHPELTDDVRIHKVLLDLILDGDF